VQVSPAALPAQQQALLSGWLVKYAVSALHFVLTALQVYQQLLQAGADASIQDADGQTAAQLAPNGWAC
jgi:ankyrin repeat protein